MPDAQKTLITDFLEGTLGPSSEDYSIADIADYRLVVKKVKDGDTVTETYAYAQHLNANGGTLGSTGVDVTNSKYIQMYNRLDTDSNQVPDKETLISAQETANIYASINAMLDAIMNQGTVGTLAGLDASTVIEPLPPEESGDYEDYEIEIFVNADNLLTLESDYGSSTVSVIKSSTDDVMIGTDKTSDPVLHILTGDDSSIDIGAVFDGGIKADTSLADVIINWPSIIPTLTTANSSDPNYILDIMAMTEANMMLWHGMEDSDYVPSESESYSASESESMSDDFDPDGFVAEWMIDSIESFIGFDSDNLKPVSEPTHSFDDGGDDSGDGGDGSGSGGDGYNYLFEDDNADVFLEIHSSSTLTDDQILDVIDLVFYDDGVTYTDII